MGRVEDTGVALTSNSLLGKKVMLGVCGGIAAIESVKLCRELRRHGAEITVILTHSAQKIITPLALRWGSASHVVTNWSGSMESLDEFDAILVAPATRNLLAGISRGMMDSPLLMAVSSAKSRKIPIMLVPSMHEDLIDDSTTRDLISKLSSDNFKIIIGEKSESKVKQPDPIKLVADFANYYNSNNGKKGRVIITLGSTSSKIDDVRRVQNLSTGETGWKIACDLHRHGYDVEVVSGMVSSSPEFTIPNIVYFPEPDAMLRELISRSKANYTAWIHAAAVLDYKVPHPIEGKFASKQNKMKIELIETTKHIDELITHCNGSVRIGFKLECGIKMSDLVHRAKAQIINSKMTAVIANRLEDLNNDSKPRAHLVDSNGEHWALHNNQEIANAIRSLIENNQ